MFPRNFIILFLFLFNVVTKAETLKSMSHKSTLLLALADDEILQKKCSLTSEKVSKLSQKLKASMDQKIEILSENDFKILNQRANICQIDCSCTIYSLAFESRNKKNELLNKKASQETAVDRLKCVSKMKNICSIIQKI